MRRPHAPTVHNSHIADPGLDVANATIEVRRGLAIRYEFLGHIRNGSNRIAAAITTYERDFHNSQIFSLRDLPTMANATSCLPCFVDAATLRCCANAPHPDS